MGFQDAGHLLLRADSLLFGGRNICVLAHHLAMRGLIAEGWLHPCFNSAGQEAESEAHMFFSEGILHVFLATESVATFQLCDLSGKMILNEEFNGKKYFRNLSHLPAGIYIAGLNQSKQKKHIKIWIK